MGRPKESEILGVIIKTVLPIGVGLAAFMLMVDNLTMMISKGTYEIMKEVAVEGQLDWYLQYLKGDPMQGGLLLVASVMASYGVIVWLMPRVGRFLWRTALNIANKRYGLGKDYVEYRLYRWNIKVGWTLSAFIVMTLIVPVYMVVRTIKKPHNGVREGIELYVTSLKDAWNMKDVLIDTYEGIEDMKNGVVK